MTIRSGEITLINSDGAKSIANILGVSERWGKIIVSVSPTSGSGATAFVGGASVSTSNYGLALVYSASAGGVTITNQEFTFDQHENPANDLYVIASDSTSIRVHVIAY